MKLCKDCKWCDAFGAGPFCHYPKAAEIASEYDWNREDWAAGTDPVCVSGRLDYPFNTCRFQRSRNTKGICGPDAKWFEPIKETTQ